MVSESLLLWRSLVLLSISEIQLEDCRMNNCLWVFLPPKRARALKTRNCCSVSFFQQQRLAGHLLHMWAALAHLGWWMERCEDSRWERQLILSGTNLSPFSKICINISQNRPTFFFFKLSSFVRPSTFLIHPSTFLREGEKCVQHLLWRRSQHWAGAALFSPVFCLGFLRMGLWGILGWFCLFCFI